MTTLSFSSGAFTKDNNSILLATGNEEISQRIEQRLKTWAGEWFLNTTLGVPYLSDVFLRSGDVPVVRSLIRQVIAETDGVQDVRDIEAALPRTAREAVQLGFIAHEKEWQPRRMYWRAEVTTAEGELQTVGAA